MFNKIISAEMRQNIIQKALPEIDAEEVALAEQFTHGLLNGQLPPSSVFADICETFAQTELESLLQEIVFTSVRNNQKDTLLAIKSCILKLGIQGGTATLNFSAFELLDFNSQHFYILANFLFYDNLTTALGYAYLEGFAQEIATDNNYAQRLEAIIQKIWNIEAQEQLRAAYEKIVSN